MTDQALQTAVITGGSRGIGMAIVRRLLRDGFVVAALSRQSSPDLDALRAEGQPVRHFVLDLADRGSVTAAASEVSRAYSSIAVLVNCAGVAAGSFFSMTAPEVMEKVFAINFFHQILFSQYMTKKMIRGKRGSVINVGSTAGLRADPGTLAYGSSKAALMHATRVMAAELGAHGIRVNAIAPSVVETDMALQMNPQACALLEDQSAIKGRVEADDVAELAAFLASDKSSKITGQIMRLDRGLQ